MLRRAIAKDLERLKALPSVDIAGNALRIDTIVGMVDILPLLSDERPAPSSDGRRGRDGADRAGRSVERMVRARGSPGSRELGGAAWAHFAQLVRVRDVRVPDALLLTPSQAYFVRENLKLRLLNARLALLATAGGDLSRRPRACAAKRCRSISTCARARRRPRSRC